VAAGNVKQKRVEQIEALWLVNNLHGVPFLTAMFQNLENNFLAPVPKVSSNSCFTRICGWEKSANTKQQLSELLLRVRSQFNSF